MTLSDITLLNYLKSGEIIVEPINPKQIQPASIDITLSNTFAYPVSIRNNPIDLNSTDKVDYKTIISDEYLLLPHEFVLGSTRERIAIPSNIKADVEGRSSLGRLGLFIQNAGFIDPGFDGTITLELYNASNNAILLRSGFRIGQIVFQTLDHASISPYNGKYQGQTVATGSRYNLDNKEEDGMAINYENFNLTDSIKIKYFDHEIDKIEVLDKGDWIDLRAAKDMHFDQFEQKLIPLGVAMQLPEGYEAHLLPRSSTYKNFGIIMANSMGIIDNSYCGDNDQWMFNAIALRETMVHKNDRICQFRIMKKQPTIKFDIVEKLGNDDRGGFGSTGIN